MTGRPATWRGRLIVWSLGLTVAASAGAAAVESAADRLATSELQVMANALRFLQPPLPDGGSLAILYDPGNAVSRADADRLLATLQPGLRIGSTLLHPMLSTVAQLPRQPARLVIAAAGVDPALVSDWMRAHAALCVTGDAAAVRAGHCMFAITAHPRPDITVNAAALAAAGLSFPTAFRMMIREF